MHVQCGSAFILKVFVGVDLMTIQQASCQRSGEMSSSSSSSLYLSSPPPAGPCLEAPGSGGGEGDMYCTGLSPGRRHTTNQRNTVSE